jgi:hypothetical protein
VAGGALRRNPLCPGNIKTYIWIFFPAKGLERELLADFFSVNEGRKKEKKRKGDAATSGISGKIALADRRIIGDAVVPPTQDIGGAAKGQIAPQQGDQSFG